MPRRSLDYADRADLVWERRSHPRFFPINLEELMMVRRVFSRPVTALAAIILVVVLFSIGTRAQDRNPRARQFPDIQLPSPARGAAALSALAPYLPQLAAWHGKSEDELRKIFLLDNTLWTDTHGRLFVGCEFGGGPVSTAGAESTGVVLEAPFPADQTFLLHSRPGATKVIYLDFDGHVTTGTPWNILDTGGLDIVSAPFDLDGIPSSFNSAERERIQYDWQRVAQDYSAFDIDVTTQDPGIEALRKTDTSDTSYGVRVVISPTPWYGLIHNFYPAGIAYVGSFTSSSDTPCYVFAEDLSNNEKDIADAASHEAGHTLGLHHDGVTGGDAYYYGQGNWAPIMGSGMYRDITQWSKGEYSGANNKEDDLAVMQTFGISYRADDHGNSIGTATALTGTSISASGIIETRGDVDMFSFQSGAGPVSFTVDPAPRGPNLDIYAALYDGLGKLVTSNDGPGLSASLTATVTAGTYYLAISGVGTGDPVTDGYSSYDSLGQYQITGTVVANGNQKPVATPSASPASGIAPLTVNFSSAGSSDPDGTIETYYWDFNDGTNSSLPNLSRTYNIAGTYTATLVVIDNQGLSSAKTVAITVSAPNQAPIAKAAAAPMSGVAPLAVSFSSAGSSDPDGTIQSYSWAFGDGTTSALSNPSHTYSTKGNYTATLVVTDNRGLRSPAVTVTITVTNEAPGANAAGTPTSGSAPLAVSFSSAGSSDPEGGILTYSWNFGDGTTSTSANPSHTYSTPGPYSAILTVTDNQGDQGTSSPVTVSAQQDPARLPDLIVSALTTSISGASITVKDTTKNQGLSPAPASTTAIYLSRNAILDGADTFLAGRPVGVLAAGGSSTFYTTVTIPDTTPPGTWYLIVVADGQLCCPPSSTTVTEVNETNNTKSKSITVPGPDLLVSSFSASVAGSTITVKDTTKNQGGKPAGEFTTNYYLSKDSVYGTDDTPIGSRTILGLASGASGILSGTLTIPAGTPAGTYYIIARADGGGLNDSGVGAETLETHNARASRMITVN